MLFPPHYDSPHSGWSVSGGLQGTIKGSEWGTRRLDFPRERRAGALFFFFHAAPEGQEEVLIRGGRIQQKKMVLIL